MDHIKIAGALESNAEVFKSLLHGLPSVDVLRRPKPEKWCLLEILCHLHDEEREDFRMRTRLVLEDPKKDLPKIDPVGWVKDRAYMDQDFHEMLDNFLMERANSVEWLKGLESPNWENTYQHSVLGPMSAKKFLCNWLAHDYLHIRQIIRLKFDLLQSDSQEDLTYAGPW